MAGDRNIVRPRSMLRCIVGPTASGKGAVGLAVARRIGAEIISLDSMKIYRGMEIGTAKPGPEIRREVPHHLIDVVEPHESYNVFRYLGDATRISAEIEARGAIPLFVGGTPLYLKALLEGIFESGVSDPVLREQLRREADATGAAAMHARLAEIDPASAARIHPNDLRRVIRALEYHRAVGRPISEARRQWGGEAGRRAVIVGIRWPREALARRIEQRVERMFAIGLPDEVQRIRASGGFSREAGQALGYKEILLAGSPEAARELIVRRTRQFARRQMTWWRRFENIHWLDVRSEGELEAAADEAAGILTA